MNLRLPAGFPTLVALVAIYLPLSGALLPSSDAPPVDSTTLLKSLDAISAKNEATIQSQRSQVTDQVLAASANSGAALDFYEQAIMETQFAGENREHSQFRDWKKANDAQLKDNAFRESVRLHLFYLGLTLRRASEVPVKNLMPQLTSYLQLLDAAQEALAANGSLLKVPVDGGIFAKWLRLGPLLGNIDKWEMNPGNPDGIAEKIQLPEWRDEKSPALLDYWDARIVREATAAGGTDLSFNAANFNLVRKPTLLWKRAQEWLVLGQRNRAISEMYGLIKTYPNHPNVADWIGTLKGLLSEQGKPAVSPATPAS